MKQDELVFIYVSWFMDYCEEASAVTRWIDIEPTFLCIPGKPNLEFPKMTHRFHKWEFRSRLEPSAHIEQHFEALLSLLEPHAETIKTASKRWKGGFNAAIYYQDFTPSIHLSARLLEIVASVNLSIDSDFYFLEDGNS